MEFHSLLFRDQVEAIARKQIEKNEQKIKEIENYQEAVIKISGNRVRGKFDNTLFLQKSVFRFFSRTMIGSLNLISELLSRAKMCC